MRSLLLLFRYVGFSLTPVIIEIEEDKGKTRRRRNTSLLLALLLLAALLPAGAFVYYVSYRLYSTLSRFTTVLVVDLARYFYNTTASVFSIFYLVGFIGAGMYAFSRSDETEILLTFPIRREVIVLFNLMRTTIGQLFTLGVFFGSALGYLHGVGIGWNPFFPRTLMLFAFLTSAGAFVSVVLGRTNALKMARYINIVTLIAVLFMYFGFIYLFQLDIEGLGSNEMLIRWLQFTNSKYNFLIWPYSDERVHRDRTLFLTVAFALAFWYYASRVTFENYSRKLTLMSALPERTSFPAGYASLVFKDLLLLKRDEQFLFLIAYPIAFSLFSFFASNKSWVVALMSFVTLSTFYNALEAGILAVNERKIDFMSSLLPMRRERIVLPKILIPSVLNTGLLALLMLLLHFFAPLTHAVLAFFPVSFALFLISSFVGIYYGTTRPGKSKNQPFDTFSVLLIQFLTFLMSSSTLFPMSNLITGAWRFFFRLRTVNAWILTFGAITSAVVGLVYGRLVYRVLKL